MDKPKVIRDIPKKEPKPLWAPLTLIIDKSIRDEPDLVFREAWEYLHGQTGMGKDRSDGQMRRDFLRAYERASADKKIETMQRFIYIRVKGESVPKIQQEEEELDADSGDTGRVSVPKISTET